MKGIRIAGALALAAVVGACAEDYMDRRDSISSTFGNATEQNMATQIIDPWPAHAADTNIRVSGQKVTQAQRNYRCRQPDPFPNGGGATAINTGKFGSASAVNITNQAPPPGPADDC